MRTLSDRVAIFASRVWLRLTGRYLPRPVVVNMFGGELLQVLIPNDDGLFTAVWRFELGDEARPIVDLVCTLTPSEARAVAHRDQTQVGFLEPVRDGMHERRAMLLATVVDSAEGEPTYARAYRIPDAAKDEATFAAELDRTVTQLAAIHAGPGAKMAKRKITKTKSWARESAPAAVRDTLREVRSLAHA